MKAILVVDIEKDVDIKILRADFEVYGDIRIKPYYQFRRGVELKPMPQYMTMKNVVSCDYNEAFVNGFNACIDEILGGEDD